MGGGSSSPWLASIPLAGLLAVVVGCVVVVRGASVRDRSLALRLLRALGYVAVAAAVALWCACGLYEGDVGSLVVLALAVAAGGALALARPRLATILAACAPAWGSSARRALPALVLAAATLAAACALELPWNEDFLSAGMPYQLLEMLMLLLAASALYLLAGCRGLGVGVLVVACAAVGVAQYFIMRFKGVAILPSDLFALRTALAVGGGYTYAVGGRLAWGLAAACVGVALTSLLSVVSRAVDVAGAWGRLRPPVVGSLLACALVVLVTVPSFSDDLGVRLMYFGGYSLTSYREQGFLTAFVAAAQDVGIRRPSGYSDVRAERDEAALAAAYDAAAEEDSSRAAAVRQFQDEAPSIVVVMNETFADLSLFDVLVDAGYQGPERFNAVDDALVRGDLAVSVLGGGTCNTEFEFLTGVSYGLVGDGKYPYVMYDLSAFDNLARQLSDLGYTCSALHPNDPTNWNRDIVYAGMGFDRFYSQDDFAGAGELHSGTSDAATYDKVIELLDEGGAPQFVFDVTMQNHSGYDQHNMPADLVRHYGLERYADDEWTSDAIDEYLACIEASDRALEGLMRRLDALDRPVVLVFFGDHQPHFSAWINDDLYEDADELTHARRVYQTSYLVWANYDVAGREQASRRDDTSPDTLAAMTLDLVGAPLTRLQRARLAARADVGAINVLGYAGADGTWHAPDADGPGKDAYDALARITYHDFGSRV